MDRNDLSRLSRALVDDVAHSDAPTPGQQALACSKHHSQTYGDLPRCIFAGTSHALGTASLRPGTRPSGADKAMLLARLRSYLRHRWPYTHILVRGDSHFATPAVSAVSAPRRWTDVVFGLAGHAVWLRQAAPPIQEARRL